MEKILGLNKDSIFRRYFWVFALLAIVLVVVCVEVTPKAYAAFSNKKQVDKSFDDFMSGYSTTLFEKMGEAYSDFADFMNPTTGPKFSKDFTDFVQGLAQMMVVLYMLINIIQEAEKGDPTMEFWTKIFIRTAVAVLAVIFISDIMEALFKLGDFIIIKAKDVITSFTKVEPEREKMISSLSTLPGLSVLQKVLGKSSTGDGAAAASEAINWYELQQAGKGVGMLNYIVWFPMAVCIFLMFSALFEIRIRQLFAPIAVATISYEGARGAGVRYLKKYLACYLKIAIYFAIAGIGTMLTFHFLGKMGGGGSGMDLNAVFMLLSNVVAGLAMMQSGGIGDEILGA